MADKRKYKIKSTTEIMSGVIMVGGLIIMSRTWEIWIQMIFGIGMTIAGIWCLWKGD